MKKNIALIALAAMFAVSCQNEITPDKGDSNNPVEGKLTATIVQTKVSYNETSEKNLQPAWEVGDEIIGFDDAGKTYTLTVASVSAETATLEGSVPDGAMHLIYKSGAKASDISNKTLAIDYTAQAGDKTMPAVMLADGTVTDGACNFAFTNAGAIIGISAVNGVPSGSAISKITVEGENLSAATVALSGSALALTATEKAKDAISVSGLNLTVTDANGTLSTPVLLAVPAGAKIAKVSAIVVKEPETMKIPSTAADKKDIDYVEIEAKYDGTNLSTKKWAKWNIGASSQTENGWYFYWAGTEGYVWYARTWQLHDATSFEFSYSLPSAKTAVVSEYMYVKTQTFSTSGQSFEPSLSPINNGSTIINKPYFASIKNTVCPDGVLALDYDAAYVNWGESWRMPTIAEMQALMDATYWTWDSTDKGYYVYTPLEGDAGKINENRAAGHTYDKTKALLFFPAGGFGSWRDQIDVRVNGFYWTSTFDSYIYNLYEYINIFSINFYSEAININECQFVEGQPVRPISD